MSEQNPNEYRDNLAQKLKGARGVDKDMAQNFLEKQQDTQEYQNARDEKISTFKEGTDENGSENLENKIEHESEVLSRRQENISNLSSELGGEEGIKEVIGKMSSERKVALEQKISETKKHIEEKGAKERWRRLNSMWDISTNIFMDVPDNFNEVREMINIPVLGEVFAGSMSGAMFVIGTGMSTMISVPEGIMRLSHKISLGLEKKKLGKLEKKMN